MHEITKELLQKVSIPDIIHTTKTVGDISSIEFIDALVILDNYTDVGYALDISSAVVQNIVSRKLRNIFPDVDPGAGARSFIREVVISTLNKKKCTICREYKYLHDYYKHKNDKEGFGCTCIECEISKRRDFNTRKLEFLKNSKGCTDCGETDPMVLEFDHIDPDNKTREVSPIRTWSTFLVEVSKCDIVCANCHKRRTAKLQGWYKL